MTRKPGAWRVADQSRLYHDLRRRNERRAGLARVLQAQRRKQIDRAIQMERERRFYQGGRVGPLA